MVTYLLIAVVATAVAGDAEEPTGSVIVDIRETSSTPDRVKHVFGGQRVSLPLVVYGGPGTHVDLKARLLQVTRSLAVRAGDDMMEVASDIEFTSGIRQELTFELAIPAVKRETVFELSVFGRVRPEDTWRRVGRIQLRAYPEDLLKPLRVLAERQPLRVHDTTGRLENFLRAQGITFLDLRARSLEHSDNPVVTLIAGDPDQLALSKWQAKQGEAVVVFQERIVTLPRIEARWRDGGSLVTVQLKFLDRLPSDPRVQKVFLEIIELARSRDR